MSEEFDQAAWKKFWIKHQQYRTVCLDCINRTKEDARREAMAGAMPDLMEDEGVEYPDWKAVFLTPASRAILILWYRKAQEQVFGKGGRRRQKIVVSDDEGDEIDAEWARKPVHVSEATKAIA